ncbi:MAG: Major Facilitator Superfamily [uncultured Acidilobus sp. OSP8]|nr:MAG: Major Facilitator Superfamily [uncultured Acidilobus sp. OSP8]
MRRNALRVQDKLAAISAIRVLGLSLTTPFIGVALEEAYRVPLAQVSAYYVILAAMGAAGQVIGGLASDRAGRVRVMALSALTAFALLAAAAALASSPMALEALTSLQSFFSGSFASSSTALVGDYFSEHAELVKAYGRVRVGANLGWALGAVVGGSLYQLLGLRTLLAFTSMTQLSTVPLILAIREPTPRSSMRLEAPSGSMLLFLGPSFLTFIIAGLMGYPLVYYFSVTLGMGTALGGSLLALNGALVVLLQDRVAALASRLRPSRALAAGMAIYAIGYAILPAVRGAAGGPGGHSPHNGGRDGGPPGLERSGGEAQQPVLKGDPHGGVRPDRISGQDPVVLYLRGPALRAPSLRGLGR